MIRDFVAGLNKLAHKVRNCWALRSPDAKKKDGFIPKKEEKKKPTLRKFEPRTPLEAKRAREKKKRRKNARRARRVNSLRLRGRKHRRKRRKDIGEQSTEARAA